MVVVFLFVACGMVDGGVGCFGGIVSDGYCITSGYTGPS